MSVTNYPGSTATFKFGVAGLPPLAYQWFFNANTALANSGNISGVTSNTLTITNLVVADAGSYTCIVTNDLGSATSSVASLVILTNPAFSNLTPSPGELSVVTNTPISFQIQEGSLLNTNAISLYLDGSLVAASITQNPATFLATVSYQQAVPWPSISLTSQQCG